MSACDLHRHSSALETVTWDPASLPQSRAKSLISVPRKPEVLKHPRFPSFSVMFICVPSCFDIILSQSKTSYTAITYEQLQYCEADRLPLRRALSGESLQVERNHFHWKENKSQNQESLGHIARIATGARLEWSTALVYWGYLWLCPEVMTVRVNRLFHNQNILLSNQNVWQSVTRTRLLIKNQSWSIEYRLSIWCQGRPAPYCWEQTPHHITHTYASSHYTICGFQPRFLFSSLCFSMEIHKHAESNGLICCGSSKWLFP